MTLENQEETDEVVSDWSDQDRNIEHVRSSANQMLLRFREKLDLLRGNSEVSEKVLRQGFDPQLCFEEAIRFFGREEVGYLAIDGTEFQDDRLDMLIFFAGAYGYSGSVRFEENGEISSDPPHARSKSLSLSSAIPISEEYAAHVSGEATEGGVDVDSERVPPALMHFAEYYLAYNEIRKDPNIRILLMDRSVSGDIAHISWKMREHIASNKHCLEGYMTKNGTITKVDLELGRMLVHNQELKIPHPRSQFLKFAAMRSLMEKDNQSVSELIEKLGANSDRSSKLLKDLRADFGDAFLAVPSSEQDPLQLKPGVGDYWSRLLEALDTVGARVFNPPKNGHPLELKDGGRWINTNDLDYLTLITIYAILKEAWKRNLLVLGIVKDTAASELVNTVIPILEEARVLSFSNPLPRFESDKMLLQANSIVNSSSISTPWRTFEYDVCFRTISPSTDEPLGHPLKEGTARVKGAFKNVITSERMFVKAYFQLWSSSNDPTVRSHVFLYDRPCYPQYDMVTPNDAELLLEHKDTSQETIIPTLHLGSDSPMSDLVMGILQSMGMEPIPEALGHNYPLFLADKKAKWLEEEAEKACTAAVELEVARSKLDQQILYESRFRDYRTSIEVGRKKRGKRK